MQHFHRALARAPSPLYRLYNGVIVDHFYTRDAAEKDNAVKNLQYNYEGIVGYVYPNECEGGRPLYRLYSGGATDHFLHVGRGGERQGDDGGVCV